MAKRAVGRPTGYDPAFVDRAKALCSQGATDADLAAEFGVHLATLYRWQASHPEFCEALKAGKAPADERVERSLYHRAVGYTFNSEEIRVLRDGAVVRVPIVEHVPPDTTAAIFWLKNRRPELWRDVHKVEHSHTLSLSDDDLIRIAAGSGQGTITKANGSAKPH